VRELIKKIWQDIFLELYIFVENIFNDLLKFIVSFIYYIIFIYLLFVYNFFYKSKIKFYFCKLFSYKSKIFCINYKLYTGLLRILLFFIKTHFIIGLILFIYFFVLQKKYFVREFIKKFWQDIFFYNKIKI